MRWALCALLLASCSTDFAPKPCAIDGDCSSGDVCELRDTTAVCVHAEDAPITIGQSAPVSGTNQALGTGMKLGVELAFKEQNDAGGIRGRQLVLDFRDDAYDPPTAEQAARGFTDVVVSPSSPPKCPSTSHPEPDGHGNTTAISTTALARGPHAVLAFLGNVGTPTMVRSAPVAIETGTIYFGAFTGADVILRDNTAGDCAKYMFNVRASYDQEAHATMDLFKKRGVPSYTNLMSFDQNDTFGQAGYNGMAAAYGVDYSPLSGSQNDRALPLHAQRRHQRAGRGRAGRDLPREHPVDDERDAGHRRHDDRHLRCRRLVHPVAARVAVRRPAGLSRQAEPAEAVLLEPVVRRPERARRTASSARARSRRRTARCRSPQDVVRLAGRAELSERLERHRRRLQQGARRRRRDAVVHLARGLHRREGVHRRPARAPGPVHARTACSTRSRRCPSSASGSAPAPGSRRRTTRTRARCGAPASCPTGQFKNLYFWSEGSAIQFFE